MANTSDIKNGIVIVMDGNLWQVLEFLHVKPGKGGAFVRTKLRNVVSGKTVDKTFNAGSKIEIANVHRSQYVYLYEDADSFVFMQEANFEQLSVPKSVVGDAAKFLTAQLEAQIAMYEGEVLYVELPPSVVLEVTYTEPGVQGDRSSAGTKPATVETGAQILVPLFIESGTKIKVDTRTSEYLSRA